MLYSGFQNPGFQFPQVNFSQNPDSTLAEISRIPESGIIQAWPGVMVCRGSEYKFDITNKFTMTFKVSIYQSIDQSSKRPLYFDLHLAFI